MTEPMLPDVAQCGERYDATALMLNALGFLGPAHRMDVVLCPICRQYLASVGRPVMGDQHDMWWGRGELTALPCVAVCGTEFAICFARRGTYGTYVFLDIRIRCDATPAGNADPLTPAERFAILKRDDYRCRLCGVAARDGEHVRLEVDHITPRSQGGTNAPSNLWCLCQPCNRGKGTQAL